ncbi:MAG: endosialidase [Defluviitaleaceae bacterium]|nr:endosialidase [Defluviitaleaceae bacterium]MCL2836083.1 endosialidase [Defluviitaleaceae bacterium]
MPDIVVENGISVNENKSLNFGNHLLREKLKVRDFDVNGHLYSVKTHNEVTRLEQNEQLLLECVPGASFWDFAMSEEELVCVAKGAGVTSLTLELAPETEYAFYVGGKKIGSQKSNMSGKINFSAELNDEGVEFKIQKVN